MIKLKNIINEGPNDWQVKDIIKMQKAHEKVLRAAAMLDKAVVNLRKISDKNANKPNGKMFITDADNMKKSLDRDLMNTNTKFISFKKK